MLLKGILHPDDAVRALEYGTRAILVSNHGGRQLDSAVAALDALPAVVEAVAGRVEVLVDGGVRRGTDVLKALALGARAVLIGRPIHWGLAVDGEAGVRHVLELLRAELALDLMLCGAGQPGRGEPILDRPGGDGDGRLAPGRQPWGRGADFPMVKLHTPIWRMIQYHGNYLLTLICGGTVHALFDTEQKRICLCSSRRSFIAMTDSSTRDRAEGMFDQGKGNVKQGVGDLTGNERMKGEGRDRRVEG